MDQNLILMMIYVENVGDCIIIVYEILLETQGNLKMDILGILWTKMKIININNIITK